MFSPYFHKSFVLVALLFLATSSFGDAYKWVDTEGETNYTQKEPANVPAVLIKAPPPPALDPIVAQKEIDTLIEKQDGTFEANETERHRVVAEAAEQKKKEEYCRVNQHNLQQLQNNPGDKMVDADGNVTRPSEEQRQQQIADLQKNIAEHCQ